MPVCVAGMHRSGTSMIMRALQLSGLCMGNDEDIIRPRQDNPAGFWENIRFLQLNEELLAHLGSSWDLPPSAEKVARLSSDELPMRQKADALIREFDGKEPWGWKDPRNSLTLPFWKKLIPNLKVVICVRNPLEVFQSLNSRGGSSFLFGISLWLIYNRFVLNATAPAERIVTHYDSYFRDPQAELSRLLEFIGMSASADAVDQACSNISPAMRHNRATTQQLRQSGTPDQVLDLYKSLCEEAGPICRAATQP